MEVGMAAIQDAIRKGIACADGRPFRVVPGDYHVPAQLAHMVAERWMRYAFPYWTVAQAGQDLEIAPRAPRQETMGSIYRQMCGRPPEDKRGGAERNGRGGSKTGNRCPARVDR